MKKIINLLLVLLLSGSLNAGKPMNSIVARRTPVAQERVARLTAARLAEVARLEAEQLEVARLGEEVEEAARAQLAEENPGLFIRFGRSAILFGAGAITAVGLGKLFSRNDTNNEDKVELITEEEIPQKITENPTQEPGLFRKAGGAVKLVALSAIKAAVTLPVDLVKNVYNKIRNNKVKTVFLLAVTWAAIEAGSIYFDDLPENIQALLTQYSPEFLKKVISTITIAPETFALAYNYVTNLFGRGECPDPEIVEPWYSFFFREDISLINPRTW